MKKVQRTLAAALAAMMLMALAGCSKGDVTKEVNSGLSDLKAQAADDAQPDPTMEQAFITLIHDWDKENAHAQ